jgi:membrane protease YdiL (CAAX protease family)
MRKGLLGETAPFVQLIFALLTMMVCGLLLPFAGLLLAPLLFDIPLPDVFTILQNGNYDGYLDLLRYTQLLSSLSTFIIPALFLGYLFAGNTGDYYGIRYAAPGKWFIAALLVMLTAIPLINLLVWLNEMIVLPDSFSRLEQQFRASEDAARKITELLINVDNPGGLFFNIFLMAVLAALGEELIFRGMVQKMLTRWTGNVHIAVVVTGFLFSMMHMQFYGFLPRWLLGVMFGYMLVWSGSVWLPVFAHFVNNALVVVAGYMTHKDYLPEDIGNYGASWTDIPVTLISSAICAWILWKMHRSPQVPVARQ